MRLPLFGRISGVLPILALSGAACSAEVGAPRSPAAGANTSTVSTGGGSTGGAAATGGDTGATGSTGSTGKGLTTVRLLTNTEYRNSMKQALGLATPPSEKLESSPLLNGFDNFSSTLFVNGALAYQYSEIAKTRVKNFAVPACQAPASEESCARSFIETFGKSTFRRPLSSAEEDGYVALFSDEKTRTGFQGGLTQVIETALQSPYFLYRSELGDASQGANRRLTSHEAATLLSYMFTSHPPDPVLVSAADANALQTPAQMEEQVRRLIQLPEARDSVRRFIKVFAGTTRFADEKKDADTYPAFTAALHAAMELETEAFIDSVLFDGDGTLNTLYTAPYTFVNKPLADLYGLPDPGSATALVKATNLNPMERAGLITQPSLLATHSKAYDSFPILRGRFVRVTLLCEALPPMPPDVVVVPPPKDPTLTTRERFAAHSSTPSCYNCHQLIDPVGFGLENYDGIGRYRTEENGKPVDARGEITNTPDMDGPYQGGVQLGAKLAQSLAAKQCLALKALQWSLGRPGVSGEREMVNGIAATLASGGLDIREVLVSIAKTDNFVARTYQ